MKLMPFSFPLEKLLITISLSPFPQRTAFPASGKKRETDYSDGDPLDVHKRPPSSAGEAWAMLLGFAMMGFSVLMFFLLGITILQPFMLSTQREESTCTAIHTAITDDWLDCAFTCGVRWKYPCLQVFVNLTHSGQKALLHYNEEAVQINPKRDVTDRRVKEKQTSRVSDAHTQ
uniref:Calcium-activated potassium channel subunit beta n=1 Tax=Aotus nancymaae TaxID=37293 RepID=A0A2K5DVD2_AOTNA